MAFQWSLVVEADAGSPRSSVPVTQSTDERARLVSLALLLSAAMSDMPPPPPPPPPSFSAAPPGYQPYQQMSQTPQFASWGSRVGGHIVNGLVALLFGLPALVAFFVVPKEVRACTIDGEPALCELPSDAGWAIIAVLGIVGLVAFFVLYSRQVATTGQAWGHKAAGVRIVDAQTGGTISAGKAFFRYTIGHWIDGVVCYLGYLWPLWDSKKQTFSDKIFSTYSVKA